MSRLKVTCRNGPLGRQARKWLSGQGPLPGDRVPDIECARAEGGGQTTLHAQLGNKWALVMSGRMVSDEDAAVVAKRLGDDGMITLVADHDPNGEIMLVRPDAHLGWRGRADPDALDRWLTPWPGTAGPVECVWSALAAMPGAVGGERGRHLDDGSSPG